MCQSLQNFGMSCSAGHRNRGLYSLLTEGLRRSELNIFLDNLYLRMDTLGIPYKARRLCFHSWRHFFNTRLIAGGIQGEITRAVVGHQSEDMTDRYLHLRRSDMEVVARVQEELVKVVG